MLVHTIILLKPLRCYIINSVCKSERSGVVSAGRESVLLALFNKVRKRKCSDSTRRMADFGVFGAREIRRSPRQIRCRNREIRGAGRQMRTRPQEKQGAQVKRWSQLRRL